jgi:hypothetical protein
MISKNVTQSKEIHSVVSTREVYTAIYRSSREWLAVRSRRFFSSSKRKTESYGRRGLRVVCSVQIRRFSSSHALRNGLNVASTIRLRLQHKYDTHCSGDGIETGQRLRLQKKKKKRKQIYELVKTVMNE